VLSADLSTGLLSGGDRWRFRRNVSCGAAVAALSAQSFEIDAASC